jgi:hypothetical protein
MKHPIHTNPLLALTISCFGVCQVMDSEKVNQKLTTSPERDQGSSEETQRGRKNVTEKHQKNWFCIGSPHFLTTKISKMQNRTER